ncbi:pilus assembly protein [bacterium c-19]|nr:pilus assembly protein [bacterium c-19]
MASSGSITTGTKEGRSVTLSWTLSSQDIANNTSTIAWTLKGSGSGSGWVMSGGFKAVINGTTVYSTSTDNRIQLYNGTVIASGSLKISHNADGTKSFKLSCEAGVYSYAVNVSASGTHTLNTIPRASSVSATSVNMGSATTISISRASSSFTHTLSYTFGSAKGTIITKTASTSVSWTPALTLANQIPSTTSGTCTITCDTYNGSTKIGTKTCTLTLTVPASVKPTISSLTASRIDGDVPSTWGIYVQSKSKATLTINGAAGSYGSTIKSYSISGGGYSGTASTLTTGFLNSSGTITFTATVTDSRGRTSAAATVSITVVTYSVPSFSSYNSQRCNSSGTISDDGTYIKATVSYSFASCISKNTVTRSTYYRVAGTSTWTNASASFNSGTAFTFGSGKISTETSYEVKYELTDAFTTISITDIVSTASVVMDFKSGGKGVAIGKVSETDNCFEVSEKWDVKVYGKLLNEYVKQAIGALYPVGSIYMSVKNTNPSTYFGGTWVAWGTGRVPVGVNTNDTNFATVEKTGGASTVTLTTAQIPSHTHAKGTLATASAGGHTHDLKNQKTSWGTSGGNRVLIDATSGYSAVSNKTTTSAGSHSHTISGSTAATGSGSAHSNLQPYITCYMWKRTA